MDEVIIARNLGKLYGRFRALQQVSFSVKRGECFGFLGHNGAGKSTTMRMIYGLSVVEEGELFIFGESIRLTPPAVKLRLGIVPQEDNLDPDLSVIENLIVYGGYFGIGRGEARRRGQELLHFMGLEDKAGDHVESLSGGLKRRLVIARALMNRPEMVVLDEPTTGLDPQARRLVWQKLRGLKSEGVTLLLTTHYMEEAAQLCDRLVIMHEGSVLAQGSPQELVARHALPEVIEIHLPLDQIPADFAQQAAAAGGEALTVAGGLFVYTGCGKAMWKQVGEWGVPQHACYLRPTTLEDVYLRLTGQEAGA